MTHAHSPGDWSVRPVEIDNRRRVVRHIVSDAREHPLAIVVSDAISKREAVANSVLLALAPALLRVAEQLVSCEIDTAPERDGACHYCSLDHEIGEGEHCPLLLAEEALNTYRTMTAPAVV